MAVELGTYLVPPRNLAVMAAGSAGTAPTTARFLEGITHDSSRNAATPGRRSMLFAETEASRMLTAGVDPIDLAASVLNGLSVTEVATTGWDGVGQLNYNSAATSANIRRYHILHSCEDVTTSRTADEEDVTARNTESTPTDDRPLIRQVLPGAEDFRITGSGPFRYQDAEIRLSRAFAAKTNLRVAMVEFSHAIYRGEFTVVDWSISANVQQSQTYNFVLRAAGDVDIDVVDYA